MEYVKEFLAVLDLILDWIIINGPKMLLASTVVAGLIAYWQSRKAKKERTAKEKMVDAVAIGPELGIRRIANSINPGDPPLKPTEILKMQKEAIKDYVKSAGLKAVDDYVTKRKEQEKKKEEKNG